MTWAVCSICGGLPCKCDFYKTTVTIPTQWVSEFCSGKLHYFECDHVEYCKCKQIRRVMPESILPNNDSANIDSN